MRRRSAPGASAFLCGSALVFAAFLPSPTIASAAENNAAAPYLRTELMTLGPWAPPVPTPPPAPDMPPSGPAPGATDAATAEQAALAGAPSMQAPPARPVYGPLPPPSQAEPPGVRPAGISAALYDAVERATANYPSVASSRLNVRAAEADLRAAKWLRFPSLSAQAFAYGVHGRQVTSTVEIDQPIWTGGRIDASIRRAEATKITNAAQLEETVLQVALDITSAYYDLARLTRHQTILEAELAEHRRLVDSIARRVEQQVSPNADLELAKSRAAQVAQDLNTTIAQRYAASAHFAQLVGDEHYDPGSVPRYDPAFFHPAPADAIAQAVDCNPTRRRLEGQALVARADYLSARAAVFPQLSAEVSHNEIVGTRAGLSLRETLDGGLTNFAAADAAKLRQQSAELQIGTAERQIRETVASDIAENAAVRSRIAAAATAAESANAVTQSYLRQYIAGRRTWLDVMNAVREGSDAEISEADAEISAMASTARLLLNTCRWQPQGGGEALRQ